MQEKRLARVTVQLVRLQGRWIVITGGSSGIGFELAKQLCRRGNRITIVADDGERLALAAAELTAFDRRPVEALRCDLGSPSDIDMLVRTLLASGTGPDVLINNAGFGTYVPFERAGMAEIERLLAVNLVGHVRLTKGLIGSMIERRTGAVSFMTSIAGRMPITPNATYCAAKHGMLGLAEALRFELKRFGVEITAICPGRVATPFFDHATFRERTHGPENTSAMSAGRVAKATIGAIECGRFLTNIPAGIGVAAWLYAAVPFITRPLFSRLMGVRIERLYADLEP